MTASTGERAAPLPRSLPAAQSTTVIERATGWSALGMRELWDRRELLSFLALREIQGTHRQTALGLSWIFLRPVIQMLLLSVVFGWVVRVPSDGMPYPLFALAGLLPWGFFSTAVTKASRSLVDNLHLISKVYFPRMMIPAAGVASGLVDFAASFAVFLAVLRYYDMPLRWQMLAVPALAFVTFAFALAIGLWLATLSARYRDVSFAVAFLLQGMMYLSPVIYPASLVPSSARVLYQLNPMTPIIEAFRWALLGTGARPGAAAGMAVLLIAVCLLTGALVFRRTERSVVDIL
jgi:lipopolysaccharide transport system permease protein